MARRQVSGGHSTTVALTHCALAALSRSAPPGSPHQELASNRMMWVPPQCPTSPLLMQWDPREDLNPGGLQTRESGLCPSFAV